MNRFIPVMLSMVIVGCSSKTNHCEFNPVKRGYAVKVENPSELFLPKHSEAVWFFNGNQEYLACIDFEVKRGVCEGIYLVYEHKDDSYILKEEVICTD